MTSSSTVVAVVAVVAAVISSSSNIAVVVVAVVVVVVAVVAAVVVVVVVQRCESIAPKAKFAKKLLVMIFTCHARQILTVHRACRNIWPCLVPLTHGTTVSADRC
jgi:hypothetical protein